MNALKVNYCTKDRQRENQTRANEHSISGRHNEAEGPRRRGPSPDLFGDSGSVEGFLFRAADAPPSRLLTLPRAVIIVRIPAMDRGVRTVPPGVGNGVPQHRGSHPLEVHVAPSAGRIRSRSRSGATPLSKRLCRPSGDGVLFSIVAPFAQWDAGHTAVPLAHILLSHPRAPPARETGPGL